MVWKIQSINFTSKEPFNPAINSSAISLTQVPSLEKHTECVIRNRSITIVLVTHLRNQWASGQSLSRKDASTQLSALSIKSCNQSSKIHQMWVKPEPGPHIPALLFLKLCNSTDFAVHGKGQEIKYLELLLMNIFNLLLRVISITFHKIHSCSSFCN